MAIGKHRRRRWGVFLRGVLVHDCFALSDKEAIDDLHAHCGCETLEEWCADREATFDDLEGRQL